MKILEKNKSVYKTKTFEALKFMDEHLEGIIESVYVRHFGKPKDV